MKKVMIISLVIVYATIMALVFYIFMTRALQVQTEITNVAQNALNQELDVLKFGNQSASDIQDVQQTLVRLQDELANVFN